MRELLHRLKSPTPAFWRRLQLRAAAASVSLATTAALPGLPEKLSTAASYLAFACGAAAGLAQLACDTPQTPDQTAS